MKVAAVKKVVSDPKLGLLLLAYLLVLIFLGHYLF
jgi:hypothetical protein